ncbi:hypothetical protein [Mesorhizobium sp. B2-6-1]|uniref:hypothetical protein n=1 Tax=Mesorhizobium sp. B2-6-1 TaxID=2589916 RepID=UPI00112DB191|nr:hypothetical protein [Mesorhizobium sp. B2-6-1]TPJ57782.1 hypothetical protein FJ443_28540 [Mesorhizobium sp. B2-6-1]
MLTSGVEIAGAGIGAALGMAAGGPAGAFVLGGAGAAIGKALHHIGEEAADRLLGPREMRRVGAILLLAADRVRERINNGERVRDDGFFEAQDGGVSEGEAVAESIISKAQREAEEKKLPYMANLFAGIGFDSTVSGPMAHQLAKVAESLTYRQLTLLRVIPFGQQLGLRQAAYRDHGDFSKELYQLLYELLDLERRGFIANAGSAVLGLTDLQPGTMRVQGIGEDLYNLMQLGSMPIEEASEVIRVLSM